MPPAVAGFVSVNKPRGISSRLVVDRISRTLGKCKAGHAGTLDPLASGVLVVAVGYATRLIDYVQQRPKRYRATFILGKTSPTDDLEKDVVTIDADPQVSREQLEQALPQFSGEIQQRPPLYSAVKLKGQRSYRLARRGRQVEHEPRPVQIHGLTLERFESPEFTITVECSQGTYIRSLGRDIAEALGTVAVMAELERTAIGEFKVSDACSWEEIKAQRVLPWLQTPLRAVEHLPRMQLDEDEIAAFIQGRLLPPRPQDADLSPSATGEWVALDGSGNFVGIVARTNDGDWRIVLNFAGYR